MLDSAAGKLLIAAKPQGKKVKTISSVMSQKLAEKPGYSPQLLKRTMALVAAAAENSMFGHRRKGGRAKAQ
ncbi:hypothetical protein EOA33_21145 [Mesorhizobium sp. M4A.F.Ca.ET.050.02.1.1]|uniref:hypothetical protein n=1 Tax=Mesorhizobium sp. M4A.F.Ca.ET.050.02.1.1 TaxID=2496754 RepID=UPI000FCB7671|nr:hypothetical protein [Mesorhizobium sp. M4A.F.Ca.ET.050.02.1.1]RUX46469.1 hypothetical protein EOA33_21145 [Mesorhizobium sp. M4A.F.Ca.ET.050.02.1.1]